MSRRPHPAPIIPASNRLLLAVEGAVSRFPNCHRHSTGKKLADAAEDAAVIVQATWRAKKTPDLQLQLINQFIDLNERIKLRLQVAFRLNCFRSANAFGEIARCAKDIGTQAGAWKRSIEAHLHGQNPPPSESAERSLTLSTRATCKQVNP